ncbi:LOW QUALITY PROTEIN: hypothetical protein KUTeg_022350 [Tegillarca granosa]|uniref:Major facilitator superfamily (MFS) profile domain-containing protein n=1 Tax=Tegillarca granosa TaxID=220873 RepID=A0ABQ9E5Z2_TEGGR|nr:LOW QUALITY PROTEIN: hypothetical protein KUTeg_022350 [Tegillarca granosa]
MFQKLFQQKTPIATGLLEKLDFRCVTFIGVVFCFVGYLTSAFVNNVLLMYLTFGITTGVGYGLIYSPSVTIISFYFSKYRALANGVVAAGSGVGGIVFPHVYRNLIDKFMLQGALMLTAAIFLHLTVTSLCLRQPKEMIRKKKPAKMQPEHNSNNVKKFEGNNFSTNNQEPNKLNDNNNEISQAMIPKVETMPVRCATFVNYWIFLYSKTVHSSFVQSELLSILRVFFAILTVLPAHITVLGISEQDVAMIVSFIGASEIVARIFLGIITDQTKLKVQMIIALTMMMSGISAIIIPFFKMFEAYVVFAILMGIFPGAVMSLMPSLLIEITSLQRLPKAFGLIFFLMSFSVIFGQPIAVECKEANKHKTYYQNYGVSSFQCPFLERTY